MAWAPSRLHPLVKLQRELPLSPSAKHMADGCSSASGTVRKNQETEQVKSIMAIISSANNKPKYQKTLQNLLSFLFYKQELH